MSNSVEVLLTWQAMIEIPRESKTLHCVIQLLVVFTLLILPGCGNNSDSLINQTSLQEGSAFQLEEEPIDIAALREAEVPVENTRGVVVLPPGSSYSFADLIVFSSFDEVEIDSTGAFSIFTNGDVNHVLVVIDRQGLPVLLGTTAFTNSENEVLLSSESTACTLVSLIPGLTHSDKVSASALMSNIKTLPAIITLREIIENNLEAGLPLANSASFDQAYIAAYEEVLGTGNTSSKVSPSTEQSGITIVAVRDQDPSDLEFRLENTNARYLAIYEQKLDENGIPKEDTPDLIGFASSINTNRTILGRPTTKVAA